MTPKEKAKELVKKFSPLVTNWDCTYDEPRADKLVIKDAKECAIIAVNQIIKALRKDVAEIGQGKGYWAQVKQEIKKL